MVYLENETSGPDQIFRIHNNQIRKDISKLLLRQILCVQVLSEVIYIVENNYKMSVLP